MKISFAVTLLVATVVAATDPEDDGVFAFEPGWRVQAQPSPKKSARQFNRNTMCCGRLKKYLTSATILSPDPQYNVSMEGFWSLQTTFDNPWCIYKPTSPKNITDVIRHLTIGRCPFSIKGGGHTAWAGAASTSDGVMIDMTRMNEVTVSADRTVASIGAGARFGQIYPKLEAEGLMVAAGRDVDVGIGGLVLGGGYSWFTSTMGFVADGLVNVELVDSSGLIINANSTHNADLFQGLKGGGNNLGLVTRYDLKAFPFDKMWGGIRAYSNSTQDQQISAFVNFTNHAHTDTRANLIQMSSYSSATGLHTNAQVLDYTAPVANPPIYDELNAIPGAFVDTTRITTVSDLTTELGSTNQRVRNLFVTLTFANDPAMYRSAVDISNSHLKPFLETAGLEWTTLYQPIPTIINDASLANGGNVMGLDRNKDNLIMYLLYLSWQDKEDDEALTKAAYACIHEIKTQSLKTKTDNPFIYLNYAGQYQDPLGGYGKVNVAKLKTLSEKYDKLQVFQKAVTGGYKINNARPTTP